jgi:hypothetical protein
MQILKRRNWMDLTNIAKYGITDGEWEEYIRSINEWVVEKANGTNKITHIDAIPIVRKINRKINSFIEKYGDI